MKTIYTAIALFISLIISFISYPLRANEVRQFKLTGFRGVEIGSAFEVHIKKSATHTVTAEGESEDIDNLQFDIDKGVLEVYFKNTGRSWSFKPSSHKVVLHIGLPDLKEAEFTGAAKVTLSGFTNEEDIKLYFSGASKGIIEDIDVSKLSIELSGASKVMASGKTLKLNINASGASSVQAFPLVARDADIDLSGACKAEVSVKNTLRVDASGASKVAFKGNPVISRDLSGAAKVIHAE
jgi:hypothetical protein